MKTLVLLFAALLAIPCQAHADVMDLPIEVQLPLLLKVITYDQNLALRASADALILAVLYSSKHPGSVKVKEAFTSTVARLKLTEIDGKPLSLSFIDVDQPGEPARSIQRESFVALYVAPGNEGRIAEIAAACREGQVATLTGVVAYAEKGLSVAVGAENGKPQIVVNLPSSKAEGCSFSSRLLSLARVIR